MNHSIYGADRTTHLKIVVLALVASIGLTGLVVSARMYNGEVEAQVAQQTKAEHPC